MKIKLDNPIVLLPSKEEDMYEHWDCQINDYKYDVKGRKRLNRHDINYTNDIHVELVNVRGNLGWIEGKANFIAFEQEDKFLIVNRIALKHLVNEKIKNRLGKGYYERYTRNLDLVTLVPLEDVMTLPHVILKKIN